MEEIEIRDTRKKEWFWLDNEYLNGYAKHLGVFSTSVYLCLCRHADNNTQQCWPSMKLMGDELGVSTKTIERAIKLLENWRIISVKRSKKKDGTQANNLYTLRSKRLWVKKPTDSQSVGTDRLSRPEPTDFDDENRQTVVLHNNTHINNTHLTTLSSFEKFYEEYPKKEAKKVAMVSWDRINPSPELALKIIEDVKKRRVSNDQWLRGFIPMPATYLNQERWNDEMPAPKAIKPSTPGETYTPEKFKNIKINDIKI